MTKQGKPYQVVRRLHAEFHQTAANVLRHAISAQRPQAATAASARCARCQVEGAPAHDVMRLASGRDSCAHA
jgi:hypothetical protein